MTPFVLPQTDELLVGQTINPVLVRFTTPFAQPTSNGVVSGGGLGANMGEMTMVDDELWVVNQAGSNVVRFAFDQDGVHAGATRAVPHTARPKRTGSEVLFWGRCCQSQVFADPWFADRIPVFLADAHTAVLQIIDAPRGQSPPRDDARG